MSKCNFDTEAIQTNETIECPKCGHYVATGLPHPDFITPVISEQELENSIKEAETTEFKYRSIVDAMVDIFVGPYLDKK